MIPTGALLAAGGAFPGGGKDSHEPADEELALAVSALAGGGVVAHATETIYGLGVDPFQPAALQRLCALKGRDAAKGWILLIDGPAGVARVARPPDRVGERLMARFWPGPLTLVLPALPGVDRRLTGGGSRVAVRWSSSPVVAALLRGFGGPVVSTSANRSGEPPLTSMARIRACWGGGLAATLDGPVAVDGLPSTVVAVIDGRGHLLRAGAVPLARLREEVDIVDS
ncbi:MAG: threonylcarbamoyl-AMP synthase [Magnetococcales bacterium]|nr:threonylcarbamoyl-AMP synthase [Magnetococcales bacterium]MBF0156603.1 threonylcarbamoyl-AMP synthase [Magnetococcales bacterium]